MQCAYHTNWCNMWHCGGLITLISTPTVSYITSHFYSVQWKYLLHNISMQMEIRNKFAMHTIDIVHSLDMKL